MKLIIGNKNYSSWSLRGWLAAKQSGLSFEEITVTHDGDNGDRDRNSVLDDEDGDGHDGDDRFNDERRWRS